MARKKDKLLWDMLQTDETMLERMGLDVDQRNLVMAYAYAEKFSQDPSTKTGIQFSRDEVGFWYGTNRAARGVKLDFDRLKTDKAYRYDNIDHAERDGTGRAAYDGIVLKGSTATIGWLPCSPCMSSLLNAGIQRLVTHKEMQDLSRKIDQQWGKTQANALRMISDSGIEHVEISLHTKDILPIYFKEDKVYL